VEKLGDGNAFSKGLNWMKAANDKLKQAKRYLKSDCKVISIG
jgi:hypothetical protein